MSKEHTYQTISTHSYSNLSEIIHVWINKRKFILHSMNKVVLAIPLAVVMAVSMIVTPSAYASWVTFTDPSDAADDNFDIRTVGITDDGNLRLTVDGTAGGTTPSDASQEDLVYAYVFVTDAGIIAVTSHQAEDSAQVDDDIKWHTHRVTLDGDGCVTSIEDFGKAKLKGNRLQVLQTGATTIDAALTAELTINGGVCVTAVFDIATP
jgi:hypothetical protein